MPVPQQVFLICELFPNRLLSSCAAGLAATMSQHYRLTRPNANYNANFCAALLDLDCQLSCGSEHQYNRTIAPFEEWLSLSDLSNYLCSPCWRLPASIDAAFV